MAKKRNLKDAMQDEMVVIGENAPPQRRPLSGRRLYSGATVMIAAIVGLIGGYLLRRFVRWI
jgi:formate-dependent nitrite reductase membrane component NrfD